MEWQPIETAPKGIVFQAWNAYEKRVVYACYTSNPDVGLAYWNGTAGFTPFTCCDGDLTHWMPPPKPPKVLQPSKAWDAECEYLEPEESF